MSDEKLIPSPALDPVKDPTSDPILPPEVISDPTPAFGKDDFLARKKSEAARDEAVKSIPPQVIKRGGIGFFTAFLMSSVAAGAGAYLALLAGSRPDLLQKAGIGAFLPAPPIAPSLGVNASNIEPLAARVTAVEAELLAFKTRLDATAQPIDAQSAAPAMGVNPPTSTSPTAVPATAIADVGIMRGELAGISGRITAIETRLAALDPTGAGGAIVAGLQADIAGLKAIIGTLQQQAAAAPSPAVTFAVVNLAEAANRSGPFMVELDTLRGAMPNVPEVSALEPFARTGVPTRELLQERFAGLAPALAASQVAAKSDNGILAWFKGLFSGMIKVQSAPNANGTTQGDVLARAKTKLDQGDFSGSLDEVATIPAPPALVTDWIVAGRKRLQLESLVSGVRSAVGRATIAPPSGTIAVPTVTPLPVIPPPIAKAPALNQGTNP